MHILAEVFMKYFFDPYEPIKESDSPYRKAIKRSYQKERSGDNTLAFCIILIMAIVGVALFNHWRPHHDIPTSVKEHTIMSEDKYRNAIYRILEDKYGMYVEGNESGFYDGFIEDCYRENVSLDACASGIHDSGRTP
jgi:hypothetical protein